MNRAEHLKLVVLYNANLNQYVVSAHNQKANDAQRIVDEQNPRLSKGATPIILDQPKRHRANKAANCRACRAAVAHSARISPKPVFKKGIGD